MRRYRAMLAVNSLLVALVPVLCRRLLTRYLAVEGKSAVWMSLTVGFLPSALLYSKYTWAETALFVLPWVILLLLCEIHMRLEMDMSVGALPALLAWSAGYAFMCHQRGVVVVIATTISLFCVLYGAGSIERVKRRTVGLIYIVHLVLALGLDRILTAWVKSYAYAGAVLKHNTLAGFLDPELYRKLFSPFGQKVFWTTVAGWMFHSGMATFGLALLGILTSCGRVIRAMRRETFASDSAAVISLQGLLCFLGALALGVLFFFQTLYGYWDGTDVGRSDHLVFGRYLESSLPVLMMLGMVHLYRSKERTFKITTFVAMLALAGFFALRIAPAMAGVDCYVHSLMALNLFMDTRAVTMTRDLIPNMSQALILFSILSLCVCGLLMLFYHTKQRAMSMLVIVLFLAIYLWNFAQTIYRVDAAGKTVYAQYYLTH